MLVVSAWGETMESWDRVRDRVSDIMTEPVPPMDLVTKVEECLRGR